MKPAVQFHRPAAVRRAQLRRSSSFAFPLGIALLFFVWPIIMIVYGAFRTKSPGAPGGSWSAHGVIAAFTDSRTYSTFANSATVAVAAGIGGTLLAVLFAWISTRTKVVTRRLVTPIMFVSLATPPLFFALSWNLLGAPGIGLINRAAAAVGLPDTLVSVNGRWGTVFVMAVKLSGLAYFMIIGAFRSMDRRLEEASLVSGAGRLRTFVHVNVPVMAPAVSGAMVISMVIGLVAFDIPLIIGVPGGFRVFSTQIYAFVNSNFPPDYAASSALAMLLILAVLVLVAIKWRLIDRRSFTTVSGKGGAVEPWDVGRWAWLCNAAVVAFALVAVILPDAQLIIGSLQPAFGVTGHYSLNNYVTVLADPLVQPALRNTLLIALVGGLLAVAVSVYFGLAGRRGNRVTRRVLEMSTWLPWATNGILLGLGLTWGFLAIPFLRPLFGTVWILLLGLIVAATPLASRTTEGALAGVGAELEESARVSGASLRRTSVGITLRLILPSFLAAWFICAIYVAGNLEVPILLSSPSNQTVAVQVFQLYQNGQTSEAAALFCLVLLGAICIGMLAAGALAAYRLLALRFSRTTVADSVVPAVHAADPLAPTLVELEAAASPAPAHSGRH